MRPSCCLWILGLLAAPTMPQPVCDGEAFAVATVLAQPGVMPAYLECLRHEEHPRWRRLHRRGELIDARVFEKTGERNDLPGPDWSILTILRAKDAARAARLASERSACGRLPGVEVVRTEVMAATPGGDHPAPAGRARRADLAFLVEFIAVDNTPSALEEYRETMRTSVGPAVGRLVQDGAHHSVLFLETRRVVAVAQLGFRWNQIHVRGYYPDPGPTAPAMTRYMEEADPTRGGFATVFKRLDAIRTKPRDDMAREIVDLGIE